MNRIETIRGIALNAAAITINGDNDTSYYLGNKELTLSEIIIEVAKDFEKYIKDGK